MTAVGRRNWTPDFTQHTAHSTQHTTNNTQHTAHGTWHTAHHMQHSLLSPCSASSLSSDFQQHFAHHDHISRDDGDAGSSARAQGGGAEAKTSASPQGPAVTFYDTNSSDDSSQTHHHHIPSIHTLLSQHYPTITFYFIYSSFFSRLLLFLNT